MRVAVLSALLLSATAAFADGAADDALNRAPISSERSRADVKAEVFAARAAGTLAPNDYQANEWPQQPQADSRSRSREEVRAEAAVAARFPMVKNPS